MRCLEDQMIASGNVFLKRLRLSPPEDKGGGLVRGLGDNLMGQLCQPRDL